MAELTRCSSCVCSAVAALIAKAAGGDRIIDLLFHLPESYLDRSARPTIRTARPGTVATLVRTQPDDAKLTDELYLTFFARPPTVDETAVAVAHLRKHAADRRQGREHTGQVQRVLRHQDECGQNTVQQ